MMFFAAVEEEEAIVASVGTERATKVCAAARDGGLFRGENGNGKEGGRGEGPDLASEAERRRFSEEEPEFVSSPSPSKRSAIEF